MNPSPKAILVVGIFLMTIVQATVINVPADQSTIQIAVDSASDGDTVLVQPGTYVENINFNGRNITVGSLFLTTEDTTKIPETIIDGNSAGPVATFNHNEDTTAILIGFTLTNGRGGSEQGGGVYCYNGASPTLVHLVIRDNYSEWSGGGISCWYTSSPRIYDVEIKHNEAPSRGGGLFCTGARTRPLLERVAIDSNHAGVDGGGVASISEASPILRQVWIRGNSTGGDGGGIAFTGESYNEPYSVIENSIVAHNSAAKDGGGIYCGASHPTMHNVVIRGNISSYRGGGIYFGSGSKGTLESSSVVNNEAVVVGGGIAIHSYETSPIITDVTIDSNQVNDSGGGVSIEGEGASPRFSNVIIQNNSAVTAGGGVWCVGRTTPVFEDVVIHGNMSQGHGGGLYLSQSKPEMRDVSITGNSAYLGGGMLIGYNSTNEYPELINLRISENFTIGDTTSNGGGLHIIASSPILRQVIVTDNSSSGRGGGVYVDGMSYPSFLNATITGNSADLEGGGIHFFHFNTGAIIANTIVWGNTGAEIVHRPRDQANTLIIAYSNISNDEGEILGNDSSIVLWLDGNIHSDPLFEAGTVRLRQNSPCINAGTPLMLIDGDTLIDMQPADYVGLAPDIGALEYGSTIAIEVPSSTISKFSLNQNYPNPFNPVSTIRYELPQASDVSLIVYDILGREVVRLVDSYIEPGYHQTQWDGRDATGREVPSGIYIARLMTPEYSKSIKMLLLR